MRREINSTDTQLHAISKECSPVSELNHYCRTAVARLFTSTKGCPPVVLFSAPILAPELMEQQEGYVPVPTPSELLPGVAEGVVVLLQVWRGGCELEK